MAGLILSSITEKKTAKEIWNTLYKLYERDTLHK